MVGILDTIRAILPDISTIAMGTASSTATVLLVCLQFCMLHCYVTSC